MGFLMACIGTLSLWLLIVEPYVRQEWKEALGLLTLGLILLGAGVMFIRIGRNNAIHVRLEENKISIWQKGNNDCFPISSIQGIKIMRYILST